jgi:hypothetical protein
MKKTLITLLLALVLGPAVFAQAYQGDRLRNAVTLDAVTDSALVSGQGHGTVGFQISGTWSGTIQFSGTINGTSWVGMTGYSASTRAGDSTTTENGIYFVGTSGVRYVKAQFTTYTSGSATVTAITTDDIAVLTSASASGGGGAEGTVDVLSIAAGNNNIGNVDVVTLPALPAGTNNIGDVDVLTLPADPLGANADAASATGSISAKLRYIASTGIPVTGTVTVGSHAVTNAGTFATQVDGAALTALQLIDNLPVLEDAAHSDGSAGVQAFAVRRDANTSLVGADGDISPLQVSATGNLKVAIVEGAGSGGTAMADDAAFTPATTSVTPIAAFADETSPDAVDEGDAGAVRMTLNRALHVNLRDASGAELDVGSQFAEDAAHTTGDDLMGAGTVRRDSPASSAGTDGDWATANTDANGRLYVNAAGQANHDAAIAGPPVRIGARGQSADWTAVTTGDQVDALASLLGKLVTLPYALPAATWRYAGAAGGLVNTTGIAAKAAGAAGVRNYVTGIQCMNSHQTTGTEIEVRDGAAGTVIYRGWAQAGGGGFAAKFEPPLRGTAATLVEIAEVTATGSAGVVCNLQGYEAGE